jgi:putative ABC transport system permease protein
MALSRSLRDALRSLRRRPSFAVLVVGTLAVGTGATTAMFSIVDTLLIRPLPFPNSKRLVEISSRSPAESRGPSRFSAAAIGELRSEKQIFAAVEGYQFGVGTITGDSDPEIVASPEVSAGLMPLLGVTPLLGRLFNDDDGAAAPVAIVSERIWRSRYGSDPTLIGRTLTMDGVSYTIVGVVPQRFQFPEASTQIWRLFPEATGPVSTPGAGAGSLQTVAALRAGVSREVANQRLLALSQSFQDAGFVRPGRVLATGELIQKTAIGRYQPALYLMFGAVVLVLIVSCVNVTNLLLVRASIREREFAILGALGSGPFGIASQMLAEGLTLGLLGGVVGALVAKGLLTAILAILPPQMTYLAGVTATMDWRVLGFAAALSLLTCVVVSIVPTWRATRLDFMSVINRRAFGIAGGSHERWQVLLVTAQLATVVVLLSGGGLLATSFIRLVNVDLGFSPDGLTVFDLPLLGPRYAGTESAMAFMQDLDRAIEAAGASLESSYTDGAPPYGGRVEVGGLEIEGRPVSDAGTIQITYAHIADDYLHVMQIPVIQGRPFAGKEAASMVIINDVMARRFWGGRSPIGDRLRSNAKAPWSTIVGVTRNVRYGLGDQLGGGMEMYFPFEASAQVSFLNLTVRSRSAGSEVVQLVRSQVRAMDPDLPLTVMTMEERLAESVWQPRFFVRLAGAFVSIAVALAAAGVYATASYWVVRRRRELAVRIAVGATRGRVINMVLRRGLSIAMVGAAIGLSASIAGARVIEAMLFATSPRDPIALMAATLLLAMMVLIGCCVPALRAARTDPMVVLRSE